MECQLVVAEAEHLLDDPDPHDLLGRKSFATFLHANLAAACEVMPNRYQRRLHRIEQAAHLQEFGGARMLRRARAERKLVVIQSSHRGPRRFSGGIGVFPDKTDGASILFPCGAHKVPLCFHAVVRSRTRSKLAMVEW